MYRAHVTTSEANKLLEDFCLWQCQLFFLLCIMASFLMKKVFFYISTAFSSLTENISINFEHKNFKSLVITTAQLHSTKPDLTFCAGSNPARGVSEIRDGEDLWQSPRLEIRLNAFRWSTISQKQFIIIHLSIHHALNNSETSSRKIRFVCVETNG